VIRRHGVPDHFQQSIKFCFAHLRSPPLSGGAKSQDSFVSELSGSLKL
jgi:hypothetical protein